MPKVLSRTPDWLSHGSPGYSLFAASPQREHANGSRPYAQSSLPLKTLARRGTEVFAAIGNEIRWSDLVYLQELAQRPPQSGPATAYKTLQHKVHGQIQQLVISPREDHLAIVTPHTVHIAVLPDSNELEDGEDTIKLRRFQLGPTAHVLDQAPLASVLWHPLGEEGRCLITITGDAVLRVWEVQSKNRSSFQNPTLSIDLKKLANATSANQDLRASAFGAATPFSPDTAELEPAGACFGGLGTPGEDPWSAMTLWIATREGDAYALCPLLPSRWQISENHISSLVLAGIAHAAEKGINDTETSRWVLNVADQEPIIRKGNFGTRQASLYCRPNRPSSIPKLQGPYVLIPQPEDVEEEEDMNEPSDILVVDLAASPDGSGEDADSTIQDQRQSMPSLVAFATTDGRVHLTLNLERVEPQWLPQQGPNTATTNGWKLPESEFRTLIALETVRLQEESAFRMNTSLTKDCHSLYSFFVTLPGGIGFISMDSWLKPLREEILQAIDDNSGSRLDLLFSQFATLTDYPITFHNASVVGDGVSAPLVLRDSDIGYFLLAFANGLVYGANMDIGEEEQTQEEPEATDEVEADIKTLTFHEPEAREPYQPPQEFYTTSKILSIVNDLSAYHRSLLREQVKLSPMSLEVLTKAHRAVSAETNQVSIAVADLFRRCKRLVEEFHAQIREVDELTGKISGLQNSNNSGSALEARLQKSQQKSQELAERRRKLARKMAKAGQRELSDKEKAWQAEVNEVADKVSSEAEEESSDEVLWQRFEQIKSLQEDLISGAKKAAAQSEGSERVGSSHQGVPHDVRRQRLAHVDALLETESALIEAVMKRLDRLGPAEP